MGWIGDRSMLAQKIESLVDFEAEARDTLLRMQSATFIGRRGSLAKWLRAARLVDPSATRFAIPPGVLFADPPCECHVCRCGCVDSGELKFWLDSRDGVFFHATCGAVVDSL